MKLRCRIGFHKWGPAKPAVYRSPMDERLAIPLLPAVRACLGCDAEQMRDEHCLGLNPPAYTYRWIRTDK